MECEGTSVPLRLRLRQEASREGVPLTGMVELTRRCNFRCGHCYAGPAGSAAGELDTAAWKALLDEAAAAGCLELVISGGEPLLRADFKDLYVHARRLGMEVALFTNAALADESVCALLAEWPVKSVEVSVYGLTEAVARAVTGVPGAAARQWEGIRRLRAAGIPVVLKAMALRALAPDLEALEARAREEGLKLRLSAEMTPRQDGDPVPLDLVMEAREAVALEARRPGWADDLKALRELRREETRRYPCAAGQYGFFIDAFGFLRPCQALVRHRRKVEPGRLVAAWKAVKEAARAERRDRDEGDADVYGSFVCLGLCDWNDYNGRSKGWRKNLALARQERVS